MDTTERARLRARAMGAGAVAVVSSDLIAILDALDAAERAERERDDARADAAEIKRRVSVALGRWGAEDFDDPCDALDALVDESERHEREMQDAANALRSERDEARAEAERDAAVRGLQLQHDVAAQAEREACAAVADATKAGREERLAALTAEGVSAFDPARLALVVAITDAETIAAKIRARGEVSRG